MSRSPYVLITPARNEESLIGRTLESVAAQTVLPQKWIIVSDGSTDGTEEVVGRYLDRGFIRLVRLPRSDVHNFGSKVRAIRAGCAALGTCGYEFIGFLDADVSFEPDYFERLLLEFEKNPVLGIGGGIILELRNGRFKRQHYSLQSVAGAVQFFRRACYQDTGGYLPLEKGGIDAVAEVVARMHGWEVETFPQLEVRHHRRIGLAGSSLLGSRFRFGQREYLMGTCLWFLLAKCLYRSLERPVLTGSLAMLLGFLYTGLVQREGRQVPAGIVRYTRREQLRKLASFWKRVRRKVKT